MAPEAVRPSAPWRAVVAIVALAGLAALLAWTRLRPADIALSTVGGRPFAEPVLIPAPFYRQTDRRWADEVIGGSGERFAHVGCTVSCVAMAFGALGIEADPLALNDFLKENGGYTARGYLIWAASERYTEGKAELTSIGPASYEILDQNLEAGNPGIVKVTLPSGIPHWVLVVGKDGYEYLAHDPLDRTESPRPLSEVAPMMRRLRVFSR